MRSVQVSRTTAVFLEKGHPWVRPDRFTKGLEAVKAGEAVTLVDERGRGLASALAEPGGEVCARVFHRKPGMAFDAEAAIQRAWDRRAELYADAGTTAYRLVHGEGDFLPGLRIERLGDVLVVLVQAACATPHLPAVLAALTKRMPTARIVVREHLDDLRRAPTAARLADGSPLPPADTVVEVQERGVTLLATPFAGLATGIYVDQRGTRDWLRSRVVGKRVLNGFAYTGAFGVSALMAGAASAIDTDLAAPALAIASANARRNSVEARHRTLQGDCRTVLTDLSDSVDVVILDPPTAAQGSGGWLLRRDYPEILRLGWQRLAPGGLLLACCNTLHGKPFPLAETVDAACPGGIEEPGPDLGVDIPVLKGFPEGRPFRCAVRRKP